MAEAEPRAAHRPARSGWQEGVAAFRHRNFVLFFVGALLSNTGVWIQAIAVPYVVLQLSDSAVLVSVASFFLFVPVLVMGPLGGSLADRFDRRSLLLWSQAGQAVLALILWVVWAAGVRSLVALMALVVAGALVNGLNIPAWQAFVSELVPRDALLNAVTLNSAQFNGAKALGPAVGGLVLWWFGPGAAFLFNGLSFVAVIVALALMRLPRRERAAPGASPSVWRSFIATLHYGRARPGIVACFLVVTALGGLGSPFVQMLSVFARDVYHVGDAAYGLLAAGMGVGSMVALPVVAGRGARIARSRIVTWAMAFYGAAVILFGISPWYGLGVVALVIAGGGYLGMAAALNTTIQLQVDESMRGKVLAVYVMLLTGALPAGLLLQALVVWVIGPRATVVIFGIGFVVFYVWLRARTPYLAHLDYERADEAAQPKAA
jgi:MFS family permease